MVISGDHYPIRQQGEQRHLNPNRDGIRWLEEQSCALTEMPCLDEWPPTPNTGLIYYSTPGASEGEYVRPMFELIPSRAFSSSRQSVHPCQACDNYAYTWNCKEHHEVPWDTAQRDWAYACTDLPDCLCTSCSVERVDRWTIQSACQGGLAQAMGLTPEGNNGS